MHYTFAGQGYHPDGLAVATFNTVPDDTDRRKQSEDVFGSPVPVNDQGPHVKHACSLQYDRPLVFGLKI